MTITKKVMPLLLFKSFKSNDVMAPSSGISSSSIHDYKPWPLCKTCGNLWKHCGCACKHLIYKYHV